MNWKLDFSPVTSAAPILLAYGTFDSTEHISRLTHDGDNLLSSGISQRRCCDNPRH